MIKYLEAPTYLDITEYENKKSIFLAGSIIGAENWQEKVSQLLQEAGFQVINPRRDYYNTSIEGAQEEQITWEYNHLELANIILFWFSWEILAPITLFELGSLLEEARQYKKKLYIGIHPKYKRKNDVIIQVGLRAPNITKFYDNLETLTQDIIKENK